MARAAGNPDELCPGKSGKEPVGCGIGLLLVVVDPEFVFCPDKLVGRELPDRYRAGKRERSGADRRKEMALEPGDKPGTEGDKSPALFAGQGVQCEKGGVFAGSRCMGSRG